MLMLIIRRGCSLGTIANFIRLHKQQEKELLEPFYEEWNGI